MIFKTLHKQLSKSKLNNQQTNAIKGGDRQRLATSPIGRIIGGDDVVFRATGQSTSSKGATPVINVPNEPTNEGHQGFALLF